MRDITEQERAELQWRFEKQFRTGFVNSEGEFNKEYVLWLERLVIVSEEAGEVLHEAVDAFIKSKKVNSIK